jgi:hypothetical protein
MRVADGWPVHGMNSWLGDRQSGIPVEQDGSTLVDQPGAQKSIPEGQLSGDGQLVMPNRSRPNALMALPRVSL